MDGLANMQHFLDRLRGEDLMLDHVTLKQTDYGAVVGQDHETGLLVTDLSMVGQGAATKRGVFQRQPERKQTARSLYAAALDAQRAAVQTGELPTERESQTRPFTATVI